MSGRPAWVMHSVPSQLRLHGKTLYRIVTSHHSTPPCHITGQALYYTIPHKNTPYYTVSHHITQTYHITYAIPHPTTPPHPIPPKTIAGRVGVQSVSGVNNLLEITASPGLSVKLESGFYLILLTV